MSTLPHLDADPNSLLQVDLAHKAYEKVQVEIAAAVRAANLKINEQFSPVLFTAQSVLYEAMGKAAAAGFTYKQLCDVMDCDGH
jgi:hypothetical protein